MTLVTIFPVTRKVCSANDCSVNLVGRQTKYCSHKCAQKVSMARLRASAKGNEALLNIGSGIAALSPLQAIRMAALLHKIHLAIPGYDELEDQPTVARIGALLDLARKQTSAREVHHHFLGASVDAEDLVTRFVEDR